MSIKFATVLALLALTLLYPLRIEAADSSYRHLSVPLTIRDCAEKMSALRDAALSGKSDFIIKELKIQDNAASISEVKSFIDCFTHSILVDIEEEKDGFTFIYAMPLTLDPVILRRSMKFHISANKDGVYIKKAFQSTSNPI